ncbi:ATP-binding cassette domain-containing protein [bacterium]|nr:ATP-binding cassette domain-containing protein [bacterium]
MEAAVVPFPENRGPRLAVEFRELNFRYPGGRQALSSITAAIPVGCRLAIVGPSGAGKSTLLLHLNGLLPGQLPTDGTQSAVWIFDQPILPTNLASIRQRVGFVFQDPDDQLFAATVADDVAFGPRQLGCSKAEMTERVAEALAAVGLSHTLNDNPGQLSYGERKRVCLAGVLACRPELIVLDEPSSNLDPRSRRQLRSILDSLSATQIIATHDLDLVLDACDTVWVIDDGRLQAAGPTRRILSDPLLMDRHGLEVPWRLRT